MDLLTRRSLGGSLVGLCHSALRLGTRLRRRRCSGLRSHTLATTTPAATLTSSPAVAGRMVRSTIHIVRLLKYLAFSDPTRAAPA